MILLLTAIAWEACGLSALGYAMWRERFWPPSMLNGAAAVVLSAIAGPFMWFLVLTSHE